MIPGIGGCPMSDEEFVRRLRDGLTKLLTGKISKRVFVGGLEALAKEGAAMDEMGAWLLGRCREEEANRA